MTSFNSLHAKLIKILRELPDDRKNERVPGMDVTWMELATQAVKVGKGRSRLERVLHQPGTRARLQKLLEQAVEVGVIR